MTENVILVSKEKAKQLIDESPCKMVLIATINPNTMKHGKTNKIQKKRGEHLINMAKEITYQDNDFFGTLSLYGIREQKIETSLIQNILFPQEVENI